MVVDAFVSGTSFDAVMVAALRANADPPFAVVADSWTPVSEESTLARMIVRDGFDHGSLRCPRSRGFLEPKLRDQAGPGLLVAKLPALDCCALDSPSLARSRHLTEPGFD